MGVVHAHDERVERAAAERGAQRGPVGALTVHERQQVADRLDLRAVRGAVDDRPRVRDAPAVPVAPRHHARGRARRAREPVAVAVRMQAVGEAHAAPVLLAPDGEHDLRSAQRPCVGAGIGQRVQPALGHRQVQALDDPCNGALRRRAGASELAGAQELLDGVLVMALAGEQVGVGGAQTAHVLLAAALQALEQELAKARVAAHRAPVGRPRHRQVRGAQREQAIARGRSDRAPRPHSASPPPAATWPPGTRGRRRRAARGSATTGSRRADRPRRRCPRHGPPSARPRRALRRPTRPWRRRRRSGRPRRGPRRPAPDPPPRS